MRRTGGFQRRPQATKRILRPAPRALITAPDVGHEQDQEPAGQADCLGTARWGQIGRPLSCTSPAITVSIPPQTTPGFRRRTYVQIGLFGHSCQAGADAVPWLRGPRHSALNPRLVVLRVLASVANRLGEGRDGGGQSRDVADELNKDQCLLHDWVPVTGE